MLEGFVLYWMLPALICALCLTNVGRYCLHIKPEDYADGDWLSILIMSVLYPFGYILAFSNVANYFTKERCL